jgi:predicted metal-dependent peptidase
MKTSSYEELFQKVRIHFLFHHPFLSVLALSIPTVFTSNAKSAFETNGSTLAVDLQKLDRYSEDELTYLYAHALLHIVLKHPFRQKTRELKLWNQSCDIVINNIMATFSDVGVMPEDETFDETLKDKCVEEVYEILYKEQEEENEGASEEKEDNEAKVTPDEKGKLQAHIYDESKQDIQEVANEKTSSGDQEKLNGIIIQALSIAQKNTTQYAGMLVEIDTLIKPEISFYDVLKEYLVTSAFEKETTFSKPNKRFAHIGLYLPGTKKKQEQLEVVVALDSSSSVTMDEYKKFLGVIAEVCSGFYEYKIEVLPFDIDVKKELIVSFDSFASLESINFHIPKSDGGTNFDAVLRYLKTTEIRSDDLLLVLSDGEFEISEHLVCQTLFVINEKKNMRKFEQFGRVIEFRVV